MPTDTVSLNKTISSALSAVALVGTLHVGDAIFCADTDCPVRAKYADADRPTQEVTRGRRVTVYFAGDHDEDPTRASPRAVSLCGADVTVRAVIVVATSPSRRCPRRPVATPGRRARGSSCTGTRVSQCS
jgi:hypothetical protein